MARAVEDYDRTIQYHRGKANVVADALSRRSYAFTSANIRTHVKITNIRVESTLIDKVKADQATYSEQMNEEGSRGRYSRSKNRRREEISTLDLIGPFEILDRV